MSNEQRIMRRGRSRYAILVAALAGCALTGCGSAERSPRNEGVSLRFPAPDRPVAPVVSPRWSTEDARDRAGEARIVMAQAGVVPGMSVADIGAGEGYYTLRLAARVGHDGRVLAEDIFSATRDALATRVARERLDNVSVTLGTADDPQLPPASFDRIMMIHMYHEIQQPYAFLWRLRPALRAGGLVIIVDADRPTQAHGTPPVLLRCEFAAVGYRMVELHDMPAAGGYLAGFRADGARPAPGAIKPCRNG